MKARLFGLKSSIKFSVVHFAICAAAIGCVLLRGSASAHPLGPKPVAVIESDDGRVLINWLVAPDDLAAIVTRLGLPAMTPSSLPAVPLFRDYFTRNVEVTAEGSRCSPRIDSVRPEPPSIAVGMTFRCEKLLGSATIRISLLHDISPDYVTLAQLEGETGKIVPLRKGSDTMLVDFRESSASASRSDRSGSGEGRVGRIAAALEDRDAVAPLALAVGLAFLLGVLHGVTPGHGKTITAAYLVGEGGNFRHALALGGIVTITHAFSVAVLGGLAIAADELLLPARLSNWLEVAAGVLIVGLGVALLRPGRPAGHRHHNHNDELASFTPSGTLPLWRLALIGLAGGLIPSPEAIGVVFIAFSLDRPVAGVLLVVAFSVGLAAVVLAVALAAVRGARIVRKLLRQRVLQQAPRIAGAVFLAMGLVVAGRGLMRL